MNFYAKSSGLLLLIVLTAACQLSCNSSNQGSTQLMNQWIGEGKTKILVDGIHQLEGTPDAIWDEREHHYTHSQSTSRLLRNALTHDFRFRQVKDGRLSYELLKEHDILYFNVPTAITSGSSKTDRKMPRLRDDEVSAIRRFLEEGGGAMVITEHNNAYDNVEVLRPLLEPLGVEIVDAYASETGPGKYAMDVGGYILTARNFKDHFVTQDVRMISFSGGAPFTVESKGGIAFLSKTGFIDIGNYVTKEPSKWSNHRVDEGEYQGPNIPVAIALDVGKGRLVVVGDHNMLGTQWLGIGDNYNFAINALQWLAHRDNEKPFRASGPIGIKFGIEQEHSGWTTGLRTKDGFYGFFYHLSRHPDIHPMGLMDLADDVDILGILDPRKVYDKQTIAKIDNVLSQGKRLFLLVDAADIKAGSFQLLRRYLPDVQLRGPRKTIAVKNIRMGRQSMFPRIQGTYGQRVSTEPHLNGGTIAALHHDKSGFRGRRGQDIRPKSYEHATPYLLDITVEGGQPLVSAKLNNGKTVSIMDRFAVGGGEIILMIQGKIFSAHTLHCIREEPVESNRPAYELEIALMNWLLSNPAHTTVEPPKPLPTEINPAVTSSTAKGELPNKR